jgi:hypothetical protein
MLLALQGLTTFLFMMGMCCAQLSPPPTSCSGDINTAYLLRKAKPRPTLSPTRREDHARRHGGDPRREAGHTRGMLSMVFTVKDNGKPINVAYSGGTAFNFPSTVPNFDVYINSQSKMAAAAARRTRQS